MPWTVGASTNAGGPRVDWADDILQHCNKEHVGWDLATREKEGNDVKVFFIYILRVHHH
jgi:hypothetical protein